MLQIMHGKSSFFIFSVLSFELWLYYLNHKAFFALLTFQNQDFACTGLDRDPPIHASRVPGMTSICHHAQRFTG
jgi:hypothetical protein